MKSALRILIALSLAGIPFSSVAVEATRHKPIPASLKPNVILITVDTLRADHIGAYGSRGGFTPAIDGLAADSIVFENAASQVPLTLPSHASILTGTYPFNNGVQDFTGEPLASSFQTVTQSFKRNGYATGAVVSSFVLDRSWGLARGFDQYYDAFPAADFTEKNLALVERRASASVDHAIAYLEQRGARPFFLWLHLYDPHSPYDPPEPFRSRFKQDLYSGEIAYADSQLQRFFDFLKRKHLYQQSTIVLLSDHGESLGEHGEREHGFFLYQSTTHVPLILKPPVGSKIPPGRVMPAVQVMDVAPTLLDLAHIEDRIERQFQSVSLLPLIKNVAGEGEAYAETYYPFSSFGWSPLRSLRTRRFQYIDAPVPELYDLTSDPNQERNIASAQTAVLSVMHSKLLEITKKYARARSPVKNDSISAEAAEKLRALGYVPFRSPVSAEAIAAGLPDPKNKIAEFNAIMLASDAFQSGDYPEGNRLLQEVKVKEPGLYLVPFMLGEAAMQQQHWDAAAEELAASLKLNPHFDQAMTALSRALLALGKTEGALQWLQKAIQTNPDNYRAWYQLALIQTRQDPEASTASFKKVLSIQPNFPLAERDLGIFQVQRQQYSEALVHLEKAAHQGAGSSQLFNALGIAHSHTGSPAKAIESYKSAIHLDQNSADAHLNLGFELRKMKRDYEAQKEYTEACRLNPQYCNLIPREQ